MKAKIDLTDKQIGNWKVVEFSSRNPKTRQVRWLCKCVCGNEKEVLQDSLQAGSSKSCGCSMPSGVNSGVFKHGMAHKTKAYSSWSHIKSRCYNPDNINYDTYGAVGIVMEDSWIVDFPAFYAEIGEPPSSSKDWGVERIDTTLGYLKGNIKWATQQEQTRNRRISKKRNTSGVQGVYWKAQGDYLGAVAQWNNLEGKKESKSFGVNKYGLLPAFKLAFLHRQREIDNLNRQGAGYKDSHGK